MKNSINLRFSSIFTFRKMGREKKGPLPRSRGGTSRSIERRLEVEFLKSLTADEKDKLTKGADVFVVVLDKSGDVGPADLLPRPIQQWSFQRAFLDHSNEAPVWGRSCDAIALQRESKVRLRGSRLRLLPSLQNMENAIVFPAESWFPRGLEHETAGKTYQCAMRIDMRMTADVGSGHHTNRWTCKS